MGPSLSLLIGILLLPTPFFLFFGFSMSLLQRIDDSIKFLDFSANIFVSGLVSEGGLG